MTVLEAKVDALVRLALSRNTDQEESVLSELELLAQGVNLGVTVEEEIAEFLTELGLIGRPTGRDQVVKALELAVEYPQLLEALCCEFYPKVAEICGAPSGKRVMRNIFNYIEKLWNEGNPKVLNHYFANSISIYTGRPTTGAFLTVASREIRRRLGR